MHVIVGTAGHIDHGKTALVRALTGVDADRLPEEKRRGITIDLGFAEMAVGDTHFGFVDVPGHERFVKNMLAGASGIDIVMLVIAAGEGVMPQTREHFDICRLLGVCCGIIAITKADLTDADTLELAKLEAGELVAGSFLQDSPIIAVSSRTGAGIENLRSALASAASALPRRSNELITRLAIDRSFSIKGFGAVVTGTLSSGTLTESAEVQVFPGGAKARIRGLQTHGDSVAKASAGQRVAVNLGGIDHSKLARGMILADADVLEPTQVIDAKIEVLQTASKPLRTRGRVRVHIGTAEVLARIQPLNPTGEIEPGGKAFAQIRFEKPVITIPGERFIIRSYSPQATIAGGIVIENLAVRHRKKDFAEVHQFLAALTTSTDDHAARITLLVQAAGNRGISHSELWARTGLNKDAFGNAVDAALADKSIVDSGKHYIDAGAVRRLANAAVAAVVDFHTREPLSRGMSKEMLREAVFTHLPVPVFTATLSRLESTGQILTANDIVRIAEHSASLSPEEATLSKTLSRIYNEAGLEVPRLDEALAAAVAGTSFSTRDARKIFQLFLDSGEIVKVTDEFYCTSLALDAVTSKVKSHADRTSDRLIDVAKFKDLAGVSRKYAIPLLEYFDRERVTQRAGDKRIIL